MIGTIVAIAIIAHTAILWRYIVYWMNRAENAEAELEKAKVCQKADILAEKLKAAWAAKRPETLADTATENDLVGHETTVTNTRPEGGAA